MRVGRVTPGVRVCDSLGVVERVDRLDIEPLVDRVIYGEDDREVLAAGLIPAKASEGVEGLQARPRNARHGDERQQAVLAGEVELRVDPLDLDDAGHIRVETGGR